MAHRRQPQLCRAFQLRKDADGRAVSALHPPHTVLHQSFGAAAGAAGCGGGGVLPSQLPRPRPRANYLHHAHDGNPGRHRPGLDDDVPPPTRSAELPADQRGATPLGLGVRCRHRDPDLGHGRNLAMDAAGDADRSRRPSQPAHGPLRSRGAGRRQPLAGVLARDAAAGLAIHHGGRGDPRHRRTEGVRHDIRHQQRRTRHRQRNVKHPIIPAGIQLL